MSNITLYKICEQKMNYLNYSKNIIRTYLNNIDKFILYCNCHYNIINSKHFQLYLNEYNFQ